MVRAAGAAGGHVDLACIGLGVGDELWDALGRQRRIHHHDHRDPNEAAYRDHVAQEIVIDVLVKRRVDGVRRIDKEQRVAVRRRAHDRFGRDIGAGARPVLDDELLTEPLREPLPDQPRRDIDPAAGRKSNEDAHRPSRISLRPRDPNPR